MSNYWTIVYSIFSLKYHQILWQTIIWIQKNLSKWIFWINGKFGGKIFGWSSIILDRQLLWLNLQLSSFYHHIFLLLDGLACSMIFTDSSGLLKIKVFPILYWFSFAYLSILFFANLNLKYILCLLYIFLNFLISNVSTRIISIGTFAF